MKKIITVCILVLSVFSSLAQIPKSRLKTQRVQIKVVYDHNLPVDSISIEYFENSWGNIAGFKSKNAHYNTSNHLFYFDLPNNEPIAYFSLWKPKTKSWSINFISGFISEPGDDVTTIISEDKSVFPGYKLSFSGKGSAKYQCQYELSKTLERVTKLYNKQPKYNIKNGTILRDTAFYSYFQIQLESQIKASTETFKINLQILERYRGTLSPFIYDLLKAQIYGALEDTNISSLNYAFNIGFNDRAKLPNNAQSVENSLLRIYQARYKCDFSQISDFNLALSSNFLSYSIKKGADTIFKKGGNYNYLRNNFKGILRDRLMGAYFTRYFFWKQDAGKNVADALTFVKTEYCRSILKSFNNSLVPGRTAFKFDLPDSSGTIKRMDDFKGKVVLMDFWFTGCSECRKLADRMKPVVEQFEQNDKIVFVSVCIDRDILKWKESLKSGQYTHLGSIDLSTEFAGGRAIINHYKIFGYPTMIVIDKDGKIVTGSPPNPSNPDNVKALIDLLDKAISNN